MPQQQTTKPVKPAGAAFNRHANVQSIAPFRIAAKSGSTNARTVIGAGHRAFVKYFS